MKVFLILLIGICPLLFPSCKDLPDENNRPFFSLNWDTIVLNKGFILPGDTVVFKVSALSQTEVNELAVEAKRKSFERLEFEGPGNDSILKTKILFLGKNLNQYPIKQVLKQQAYPGIYTIKTQVVDQNKNQSPPQSFSFNFLNPDFPALAIDSPVNSFFTVPEIKNDSFLIQIRGYGTKISELSYQWFDSLGIQSVSPRQIQPTQSEPNESTLKRYIYFPAIKNRNIKLRLGIKNKSEKAAYYWLDVKRKP